MVHMVQLPIPEDVYNLLTSTSKETGQSLEELALKWLKRGSKEDAYDPMDDFIGSISTDTPSWGDRHDELIGEALYRELRGEDPSGN